jgi:hypothetical protein
MSRLELEDLRQKMIRETERFLTRRLRQNNLPSNETTVVERRPTAARISFRDQQKQLLACAGALS